MIKVLLVDDQQILAEGIKSVLETCREIKVIGIALDGAQAVEKCASLKPDVVLMDIRMPNMNGMVATKRIKEADENIKIVVLTTFDDSDYILSAINNGASGYLLKDIGSSALIDAVKNAYAGDTILPAKIAKNVAIPNAYGLVSIGHISVNIIAVIQPNEEVIYFLIFSFLNKAHAISHTKVTISEVAIRINACVTYALPYSLE